jgi:hypothetical protein
VSRFSLLPLSPPHLPPTSPQPASTLPLSPPVLTLAFVSSHEAWAHAALLSTSSAPRHLSTCLIEPRQQGDKAQPLRSPKSTPVLPPPEAKESTSASDAAVLRRSDRNYLQICESQRRESDRNSRNLLPGRTRFPSNSASNPATPVADPIFPKTFTPACLASSSQHAKACSIDGFQNPKSRRRRRQIGSRIDCLSSILPIWPCYS